MGFPIDSPLPLFYDRNGSPLDAGFVYIGTVGLNPITNPIAVYWDAGQTIPAPQPLRTVRGYIARNGAPADIYVNSDYSIVVQDKNRALVLNEPNSAAIARAIAVLGSPANGSGADLVANADRSIATIAALRAYPKPSLEAGRTLAVTVIEHTAGTDKGGGQFLWDANSTLPDDNGRVINPAGNLGTGRWLRMDPEVTPEQFGALGIVGGNDTAAISSMEAHLTNTGTRVVKLQSRVYPTTNVTASATLDDTEWRGQGLITDDANLYRWPCDEGKEIIGREYLALFHSRINAGIAFRLKVWGDSRPQGNSQTGNFIWHNALREAARQRGYYRGVFENDAVGGSTILDWTNTYVDANLDGTDDPHLVVFCAGINDLFIPFGPATPAQVVGRLDAMLQKIRLTKGYGMPALSIAVVVPISAYNPSQGRDPRFIEPLRKGFRNLARKWQVCIIDGYAVAADATNQRGLGFAADLTAPEVIHQNNTGMIPILNQLIETVMPDITPMRGGNFSMESGTGQTFTAAQLPADYPLGISMYRAAPGGGGSNWPLEGFVKTENFIDDIQVQYNYATSVSDANVWIRKGRANAWGTWRQITLVP